MKAVISSMIVGALAKQAGVKIDTIRYYERCGLLPRSRVQFIHLGLSKLLFLLG